MDTPASAEGLVPVSGDGYFQMQLFLGFLRFFGFCFFFPSPALVKADFTTGQIAYIWIRATLNPVYSGDLSEASAWKTGGFLFEKAILLQTD